MIHFISSLCDIVHYLFIFHIFLIYFRTIPDNFFPIKAVLDQQTTDNLITEVTNQALDTSSKTLRSKKSKQTCLILDDYEFQEHSSPIGKSPIDSLCGLVESIDVKSKELNVKCGI